MIKTAFFVPKKDVVMEDLIKEKSSIPQFLWEMNEEYINELSSKKNLPSAYRSLIGIKLLGELIADNGINPRLKRDANGRPFIENIPNMDFNISHSDSLVVCALCISDKITARIGVDCEEIYKKDPLSISKRFFTEKEHKKILSSENKAYTFTELWTKKEAYLKHLGTGLEKPLSSFESDETGLCFETLTIEKNIVSLCYCKGAEE